MENVGEVIHNLRRRKGWTQGQLAYRAGTSPEYISLIETGKRENPRCEWLLNVAVALGTTPDYILSEAGLLPDSQDTPLPPEVIEVAEAIESYPDGAPKEQARQMLLDMALILRTLRERLDSAGDALPSTTPEL